GRHERKHGEHRRGDAAAGGEDAQRRTWHRQRHLLPSLVMTSSRPRVAGPRPGFTAVMAGAPSAGALARAAASRRGQVERERRRGGAERGAVASALPAVARWLLCRRVLIGRDDAVSGAVLGVAAPVVAFDGEGAAAGAGRSCG